MKNRLLAAGIYVASAGLGLLSFLSPFLLPQMVGNQSISSAHTADTPLLYMLLLGLTVVVLLFEVQGEAVKTRQIALLGVLVAINSVLRFIDIAIPGPGGFSPIGDVLAFGNRSCRQQFTEEIKFNLVPARPMARIDVAVIRRAVKFADDCTTKIGREATATFNGYWRWNAKKKSYEPHINELKLLDAWNQKQF